MDVKTKHADEITETVETTREIDEEQEIEEEVWP
jgi:AdoMet-dependent rRNA methyltransferase SPB1